MAEAATRCKISSGTRTLSAAILEFWAAVAWGVPEESVESSQVPEPDLAVKHHEAATQTWATINTSISYCPGAVVFAGYAFWGREAKI